jgi:hypothetical protein
MDIFEKNKEPLNRLVEIYIISNTPLSLYKRFREDEFVQFIAKSFAAKDLINNFISLGNAGVSNIQELVIAYALYVAITFKDYETAASFYNNEGKINFEWFGEIKEIFLSSYKPTNYIPIDFSKVGALRPNVIASGWTKATSKTNENTQTITFEKNSQ